MAPQRPRLAMPRDVRDALNDRKLMAAYRERPPYQRNDYLGWIVDTVQAATRQRRLAQMLDELRRGNVYMKMRWSPTTTRVAKRRA